MEQTQELLQKWDARARRRYPRMEITGRGFTLGAGTVLAGMARDERGRLSLTLRDEPRALALLSTAYGRPIAAHVVAKMRRAAELWNEGEKALAHIHLAFARLPPCDGEDQMLRLFLAEECLAAGITPAELMRAQGFDPAPLALLKYDPEQPRVPPGSGRESGQWTSGDPGDSAGVSAPPAAAVPASLPPVAAAGEGAGTLAADLFAGASPEFLAGLAELGATIGGAGAVLGAIFIPSPNPGLTSEGAVPGDPGLRYTVDHDEGALRLTRQDSTGAELAVVAQLGPDGVFREIENRYSHCPRHRRRRRLRRRDAGQRDGAGGGLADLGHRRERYAGEGRARAERLSGP